MARFAPNEESDLLDWALLRGVAGFVLLRAPRRHKLLAAFCFLSVIAMAVAALQLLPNRWAVQATVLAQSSPLQGAVREADRLRAAREIVARRDNLVSLMKQTDFLERHMASRSLAGRTRDRLFRALGRELTEEERLDGLLDAVEARLWVLSGEEGTITIGFMWSDPELALDVVKGAVQNFLDARKLVEVDSFTESISILEVHAANAQREIGVYAQRITDKELQLRKTRTPKRAPVRVRLPPDTELAKIDALLEAKKRAFRVMEEYRERRIAELRATLSEQQMVYAAAHPVLIATKKNLESAAQRAPEMETLRAEIADLEGEIKSRGSRPGDTVRQVQDDLAEARLRLEDEDPRLESERHELRLAFRNYASLLADVASARVAQDVAKVGFKYRYSVVSPPQVPRRPVWPNKFRVVIAALVGGLLLGLFASAAADLRTGVVMERWQVDWQLGVPVLVDVRDRPPGE